MDEQSKPNDVYLMAIRALFWIFCLGVFSLTAAQIWPAILNLFSILTPFIIGLVLAYVLHPIVGFVEHRLKLGRVLGILVVAAVMLLLVGVFLAILVPILYEQVNSLVDAMSDYFSKENVADDLFSKFNLPEDVRNQLNQLVKDGLSRINETLDNLLKVKPDAIQPVAAGSLEAARQTMHVAFSVFGWIGALIATSFLTAIITFWYLTDMDKIPSVIRRLLPVKNRERLWEILLKANAGVGGFVRGQLIACLGVGLLTTVLILIVGPRKYAVLIGFLAGSVHFIPYLGPAVGLTPAVLWSFFTPTMGGWEERWLHIALVLGGFSIIQAIDGFIFQPYVVGRQSALHPLAVMLALVVGAEFGLGGMILAVPVAAAIKVLLVEFYWKKRTDFLPPKRKS